MRRPDPNRDRSDGPVSPSGSPDAVASGPWFGDLDRHLLNEGRHRRLADRLGAHPVTEAGRAGTRFSVWAPSARGVSVLGDFNGWTSGASPLAPAGASGVWSGFLPGVGAGATYKFAIEAPDGRRLEKADPVGFAHEVAPRTASVVADLSHDWTDADWCAGRAERQRRGAPLSIYELHAGSWRHAESRPGEPPRSLSYRELAGVLPDYAADLGFTHVELLPIMEHPLYRSWGYQTTGYFAPTRRFGEPADLMHLIDRLHARGIGVILDWVPSHFPLDEHGLATFDGTHLYEHADPREGFHPDWTSGIFNYGRHEVRAFLISSALFWLERYHADGLRVDAVASMLYRDYSRAEGEWVPNEHGGRENLEAIHFLRELTRAVHEDHPGALVIAEESTAWPGVTAPVEGGGLGFDRKWDMGWMHDTLGHLGRDPVHRRHHHDEITFRAVYQNSEAYVLPLSHDEVVHGKGSLLGRMPGDDWRRFANLRLLLASQWSQPGGTLLFMGGEFGQSCEWNQDRPLEWAEAERPAGAGVRRLVGDLNRVVRGTPALHEGDDDPAGFEWAVADDHGQSVLAFLRRHPGRDAWVLVVLNLTPVVRDRYRIGVPSAGRWREILNSDAAIYGGSDVGNLGGVDAEDEPAHGRPASVVLTLPPLGALWLAGPGTDAP